jgi:NAD(P)-dependent dehydrogenase (short-subunit alcohol dehydrogenase family)
LKTLENKIAVITGGASGFGLEFARYGAQQGMRLVLADVQQDALDAAKAELEAAGAQVVAIKIDVSSAAQMDTLAAATVARFGVPHLLFNNAGVGAGGLLWEHTLKDWEWVINVNLWGVAHGVRVFVPLMLQAAKKDPSFKGHIVNTASMAGLVNAPNMGAYNVTKHAVVSLSETLYQDLALVTEQIKCSVLCPYFVPTGINQSSRNRPEELKHGVLPTRSQLIAQAMSDKAVTSGKITAAQIAQKVFEAISTEQFYIFSHPQSLQPVQTRLEDVMQGRNPSDPFAAKPELGIKLRAQLREQ